MSGTTISELRLYNNSTSLDFETFKAKKSRKIQDSIQQIFKANQHLLPDEFRFFVTPDGIRIVQDGRPAFTLEGSKTASEEILSQCNTLWEKAQAKNKAPGKPALQNTSHLPDPEDAEDPLSTPSDEAPGLRHPPRPTAKPTREADEILRRELAARDSRIEELENRLDAARTDLDNKSKNIHKIFQKVRAEFSEKLAETTREIQEQAQAADATQAQLAALTEQMEAVKKQAAERQQEAARQKAALQLRIDTLTAQSARASESIAALTEQNNKAQQLIRTHLRQKGPRAPEEVPAGRVATRSCLNHCAVKTAAALVLSALAALPWLMQRSNNVDRYKYGFSGNANGWIIS